MAVVLFVAFFIYLPITQIQSTDNSGYQGLVTRKWVKFNQWLDETYN